MAGAIVSPAIGGELSVLLGLRAVYGIAAVAFLLSFLVLFPLTHQAVVKPTGGASRYGQLLRNTGFLRFLVLYFVALGAVDLSLPFASNFVVDVHEHPTEIVGWLGSFSSLGALLLNLLLGHSQPRRGFLISPAS